MFERYTEKARRVIFFAHYEASQYGSAEITPEHLLLGVLREGRKTLGVLFPYAGNIDQLEKQLRAQQSAGASRSSPVSVDLPLSNASKRILAYTAEEAERLSHRHIGTEHLVLGMVREHSPAAEVLTALGITLAEAREKLRSGMRSGAAQEESPDAPVAGGEAQVEFVEEETNRLVALLASPIVLPSIGEEVVFGGQSFRVTNVTYFYPEVATLAGIPPRLLRIRVSLELLAETI